MKNLFSNFKIELIANVVINYTSLQRFCARVTHIWFYGPLNKNKNKKQKMENFDSIKISSIVLTAMLKNFLYCSTNLSLLLNNWNLQSWWGLVFLVQIPKGMRNVWIWKKSVMDGCKEGVVDFPTKEQDFFLWYWSGCQWQIGIKCFLWISTLEWVNSAKITVCENFIFT